MKFISKSLAIVILLMANSPISAVKLSEKEASEMPVMVVMRRAPRGEPVELGPGGPKLMMVGRPGDYDESAPAAFMHLPPPMMGGMAVPPPANFLSTALQSEMVQEMKKMESQLTQ